MTGPHLQADDSRCGPARTVLAVMAGTGVGSAAVGLPVVVIANGMDASTVITNAAAFGLAWWLGDRSRRAAAETGVQRSLAAQLVVVADESGLVRRRTPQG